MSEHSAVADAVSHLGGPSAVARARELTPWAVSKWMRSGVPSEHVIWLAEQTAWRYTPHQLSPLLYPHPDDGLPQDLRRGLSAASA
jgi:hypothetical protein